MTWTKDSIIGIGYRIIIRNNQFPLRVLWTDKAVFTNTVLDFYVWWTIKDINKVHPAMAEDMIEWIQNAIYNISKGEIERAVLTINEWIEF